MRSIGDEYREWIASYPQQICEVSIVDRDHVRLVGKGTTGELNFYDFADEPEIVEMRLWRDGLEDQDLFFLHFGLEDLTRAQDLFREMLEAMSQQAYRDVTHVLLCCTSGMTTTLFATRMNEVARTLSLAFEFDALPFEEALREGTNYAAVLLAPQVGYRRKEVVAAFPGKIVLEIPAKTFGSYDAGAAVRLLLSAMETYARSNRLDTPDLLERDLSNDKKILVVSSVFRVNSARLGYRVYDHGNIVLDGRVYKRRFDIRDIEDVTAAVRMQGIHIHDLDAISIALPGLVHEGTVSFTWGNINKLGVKTALERPLEEVDLSGFDLKSTLEKRFEVPVFVENNANAAAVGCYVSEDSYENIVLYTQRTGHPAPGLGTIVNGQLVHGLHGGAGEMLSIENHLIHWEGREELCWTQAGMTKVVAEFLLCSICTVAPEAAFIAVQLVPDMDLLREELQKSLPDRLIPELIHVDNYHERIMVGGLALGLHGLQTMTEQRA